MQVYKDLEILSARPNKKEEMEVYHHLFGIVRIDQQFSVGHWLELARKKITVINGKGKSAIVAGGSGLYLNAAINGISKIPQINSEIKKEINKLFRKLGKLEFYKYISKIDPEGSKKILPTDTYRMIRACEVFLQTKKSISWWHNQEKIKPIFNKVQKILIQPERQVLYESINRRFDQMFDLGLIQEIKSLKDRNYSQNLTGMKALGLKHLLQYLDGVVSFKQAINLAKRDTRRYAKRQVTWFRNSFDPDVEINLIYNNKNYSKFSLEKIVNNI